MQDQTPDYPKEKECERRVRLYRLAIKYFTEGEGWEHAIALCEELRKYYQSEAFDYGALAELLVGAPRLGGPCSIVMCACAGPALAHGLSRVVALSVQRVRVCLN
jgi:hypothetical protein